MNAYVLLHFEHKKDITVKTLDIFRHTSTLYITFTSIGYNTSRLLKQ